MGHLLFSHNHQPLPRCHLKPFCPTCRRVTVRVRTDYRPKSLRSPPPIPTLDFLLSPINRFSHPLTISHWLPPHPQTSLPTPTPTPYATSPSAPHFPQTQPQPHVASPSTDTQAQAQSPTPTQIEPASNQLPVSASAPYPPPSAPYTPLTPLPFWIYIPYRYGPQSMGPRGRDSGIHQYR